MQITTDGIVIKENAVGDYDRAVTLLTRDIGVVRAFSVGARRLKSKKNASTSLLAYSRLTLKKSREVYRIEEAESKEMFFGLRGDIVKLSVAQYLCELCAVTVPENETSEELLRLILNTLAFLSDSDRDPYLLKSIAELRLVSASGYAPDLVGCRECGCYEADGFYFDTEASSLLCRSCAEQLGAAAGFKLDMTLTSALRHIVFSDFSRLFSFTVPEERARALSRVTEGYVLSVSERGFKSLDFLHSLDF